MRRENIGEDKRKAKENPVSSPCGPTGAILIQPPLSHVTSRSGRHPSRMHKEDRRQASFERHAAPSQASNRIMQDGADTSTSLYATYLHEGAAGEMWVRREHSNADRNEGESRADPCAPAGTTDRSPASVGDRRGAPATSRFCARTVQVSGSCRAGRRPRLYRSAVCSERYGAPSTVSHRRKWARPWSGPGRLCGRGSSATG